MGVLEAAALVAAFAAAFGADAGLPARFFGAVATGGAVTSSAVVPSVVVVGVVFVVVVFPCIACTKLFHFLDDIQWCPERTARANSFTPPNSHHSSYSFLMSATRSH